MRLLVLVGCFFSACGMSAAARGVRVYADQSRAAGCENMGLVNGSASGWGDRFRANAEDDAREQAAKMGADALVVRHHEAGIFGHRIIAESYRCAGQRAAQKHSAPVVERKPLPALAKPTRVLLLDPKVFGLGSHVSAVMAALLSAELHKVKNLSVVGGGDIDAAIDTEKKKDLIGCDSTSCLTEIAGALGANLVVHGSIGMIGTHYVVTVSLFDTKTTAARARFSKTIDAKEDDLIALVPEIAAALAMGF